MSDLGRKALSGIVIVTSLLPPLQGGPAGQASLLARFLSEKGVNVSVVLVGNQTEVQSIPGVLVTQYRLPTFRFPGLAAIFSFIYAFGWLRKFKPCLVHIQVFNNPPAWGFATACRLFGIPTYCKVASEGGVAKQLSRGYETDWRRLKMYASWSDKLFCKTVKYVLATTETFEQILAEKYSIPTAKVLYFPNFTESHVHTERLSRLGLYDQENMRVWKIVTVARGVRQKNIEGCLAVARRLRERGYDFMWTFVGDFDRAYRSELDEIVRRDHLDACVVFVGAKDAEGVRHELEASHVFVMLSYFEWFGISAIEAMDTGVPVVVADVPGMAEIVSDCGECVDPFNAEQAANAIERYMMDPKVREEKIKMGIDRVSNNYRIEIAGEKLYQWYLEHSSGVE